MITGDARATAQAVAAEVGVGRVLAEVLPEGKADAVAGLQAGGRRSPSSATASMTRPPWPARTWAWRSAPEPTWRWRRPT